MSEQLGLFTRPAECGPRRPLALPPIAARRDPPTSAKAAAELTRSGARQRQIDRVVGLVRRWPGCTSRELAEQSGCDRYMVARRLADAKTAHLVTWIGGEQHPEQRVCRYGGRLCVQWVGVGVGG